MMSFCSTLASRSRRYGFSVVALLIQQYTGLDEKTYPGFGERDAAEKLHRSAVNCCKLQGGSERLRSIYAIQYEFQANA